MAQLSKKIELENRFDSYCDYENRWYECKEDRYFNGVKELIDYVNNMYIDRI